MGGNGWKTLFRLVLAGFWAGNARDRLPGRQGVAEAGAAGAITAGLLPGTDG